MKNRLEIIGNVTRDAEVITTKNGKELVRFAVAVNRGKNQPADFFEIACWERPWVANVAKKGRLILVEGPMLSNKSDDGITYWTVWANIVKIFPYKYSKKQTSQSQKSKKKETEYTEIYVPEDQVPQYEVEY